MMLMLYRGAKTAMALALRSPNLVRNIISVDNAPVDAVLESGFGTYVEGMKRIERAGVMRQAEADDILKNYEEVIHIPDPLRHSRVFLFKFRRLSGLLDANVE